MDGFTRPLASGGCPPLADLLLALAAEFRAVDADAVDAQLDDLALPVFGLTDDPRHAAERLAGMLDTEPGFHADRASVAGLWLDAVLESRTGHPLMLAALAAEVGRRAGLPVQVYSAPTGWYAGVADSDRLWLVDATMDGRPRTRGAYAGTARTSWRSRPCSGSPSATSALVTPGSPAARRCCAAACLR